MTVGQNEKGRFKWPIVPKRQGEAEIKLSGKLSANQEKEAGEIQEGRRAENW